MDIYEFFILIVSTLIWKGTFLSLSVITSLRKEKTVVAIQLLFGQPGSTNKTCRLHIFHIFPHRHEERHRVCSVFYITGGKDLTRIHMMAPYMSSQMVLSPPHCFHEFSQLQIRHGECGKCRLLLAPVVRWGTNASLHAWGTNHSLCLLCALSVPGLGFLVQSIHAKLNPVLFLHLNYSSPKMMDAFSLIFAGICWK